MASRRKSSCSSVYLRLAAPRTHGSLRRWRLLPHEFMAVGVTSSPNSSAKSAASCRFGVTGQCSASHAFCSAV